LLGSCHVDLLLIELLERLLQSSTVWLLLPLQYLAL
jgi:hypothetical protein